MLDRFFGLRGFISLEDEELAELMPSPASQRKLKALLEELADYQSVTMALQGTDIDLLGTRDLLDGRIEKKPSMKPYIESSANIIHSPAFESGCCKVLDGSVDTLTRSERQALCPLLRCENQVEDDRGEAAGVGFAERILKRRKTTVPATSYPLVWAIHPTSNLVERLFSTARAMLGHERQALTPLAVEMILFLKTNATYWDARIVDRCV